MLSPDHEKAVKAVNIGRKELAPLGELKLGKEEITGQPRHQNPQNLHIDQGSPDMVSAPDEADEIQQNQRRIKEVHLEYVDAEAVVEIPEADVSIPYVVDHGMIVHKILLYRIAAHIRKSSKGQKAIPEDKLAVNQKTAEKQQHFQNQHGSYFLPLVSLFHKIKSPFNASSVLKKNLLFPG